MAESSSKYSDDEFYNVFNSPDSNCECLSCQRYLVYKKERDPFKSGLSNYERVVKQPCNENCDCPYCQTKQRFHKCLTAESNSLCYKINHNISLNDCDCKSVIVNKDVDNHMNSVDKNLPIDYMEDVLNRFNSCLPCESESVAETNLSDGKSASSSKCSHESLPLPISTPKSYNTEENPNNYDVYHMNAKAYGLSARSAFKLLQIDEKYGILNTAKKVVDLCAAPGGWSKVLSTKLFFGESDISNYSKLVQKYNENQAVFNRSDIKIVAVDLMDMLPIPGVIKLIGDITKIETANAVVNEFNGELADVVVCDGAADVSISLPLGDIMHRMVINAALHITCNVLKLNGTFVMKVFYCNSLLNWVKMMKELFNSVEVYKPDSSRQTSQECFLICQKYAPPKEFNPKLLTEFTAIDCRNDFSKLIGINKEIIPILVCDDYSFKKNYTPFLEAYKNHSRIIKENTNNSQWKAEINELKIREKDLSSEEFDLEFKAILRRIKGKVRDDELLAKKTREQIISQLEKRGNDRNFIEFSKFSKSKNAETQRIKEWARIDSILCPCEDGLEMKDFVENVLRPINKDKLIRNAECEKLRENGGNDEEIIKKRIDLFSEHQRNKFSSTDNKSWITLRVPKSNKKNKKLTPEK